MTKPYNKLPESTLKIRFTDCDPFNHLNNSRYIDYMMAARSDQLLSYYNFDMYLSARTEGVSWVAAQTQIAYLSPAFLSETVCIQTRLIELTTKSLLVEAVMFDENKIKLKSLMWAKLVHFDLKTQRSIEHSPELTEFLLAIYFPLSDETSFDQRIKSLKEK